MAVSERLRFEILKRDVYTCRYCGGRAPDVALTVDHVIPAALGGSDEAANLVAACQPCNSLVVVSLDDPRRRLLVPPGPLDEAMEKKAGPNS